MGIYSGKRWALIEEHLHDMLGRQARDAGDAPAAARHFMAMLACPQASPFCQRLYLTQFMEALQAAQQQLVQGAGGAMAWRGWQQRPRGGSRRRRSMLSPCRRAPACLRCSLPACSP